MQQHKEKKKIAEHKEKLKFWK